MMAQARGGPSSTHWWSKAVSADATPISTLWKGSALASFVGGHHTGWRLDDFKLDPVATGDHLESDPIRSTAVPGR